MKTKTRIKGVIRWILDILMTIVLFLLMGYQFWDGKAHEWFGAGMFVLFIAHQVLNPGWYRSLCLGKYTPVRIFWCIINLLTLAAMLALMYSGITMSRHVFAFLPLRGGMALARRLHMLGAYWGFLFMGMHLGLHWGLVLNKISAGIRKTGKEKVTGNAANGGRTVCFAAAFAVAAYGVYVFIKRDFFDDMFLKNEFVFLDYGEPAALFFIDYLSLMGLSIFISHYGLKLLKRRLK